MEINSGNNSNILKQNFIVRLFVVAVLIGISINVYGAVDQNLLPIFDASTPYKNKSSSNVSTQAIVGDGNVTLGEGYDTDRALVRGECLTGEESPILANSTAEIVMDGSYTHNELLKDLNISAGGGGTFAKVFNFGASAKYAKYTEEDDTSLVFLYKNRFFDGTIKYRNYQLTVTAQNLLIQNDLQGFRERCGNRFLNQVNIGGGLFYSIKLIFNSSKEKMVVKRKANGSFLSFKASGSFKKTVEKENINGSIVIRAIQSGGNVSALGAIFAQNGGATDGVVKCNFGDMTACENFVASMNTYASISFPQQLDDSNNLPNVLDNTLLDYGVAGAPATFPPPTGLTNDVVNDPVWIMRRNLLAEGVRNAADIDSANVLASLYYTKADRTNYTIVNDIFRKKLEPNQEALAIIWRHCWNFPATCLAEEKKIRLNNIIPIAQADRVWLEYPEYFAPGSYIFRIFAFTTYLTYKTNGNGDYCVRVSGVWDSSLIRFASQGELDRFRQVMDFVSCADLN